jgi:hypothetical protein
VSVLTNFVNPVVHVIKTVLVCHIVDKYDACSPLVISMRQGPELDLTGGVPDCHSNLRALMHNVLLLVVHASCSNQFTLKDAV